VSDFALRFGLALIVVLVAGAAVIISRRNYAKSAVFERNIESFRLEFQRSIDAAQAATIKSVAKTIRESLSSVVKPIDSAMRDLDVRLARLEQHQADATAAHAAGTQILDVRLARLEEHADTNAIRNLEARFADLQRHTETTATQIAGTQAQSLDENERIAARLIGLEQKLAPLGDQQQNLAALGDQLSSIKQTIEGATLREQENIAALSDQQQSLTALTDQLSSIKKTIDEANVREQDIKNSIDGISSRILDAQTRLDELLPRLALGEKAREGQGTLIGLFVKRLKKVNAILTDTALRLSDLECNFRLAARQLDAHPSSILDRMDGPSTSGIENPIKEAPPQAADGASPIEAKTDGQNAEAFEPPAQNKESSAASVESESRTENVRADQHAT